MEIYDFKTKELIDVQKSKAFFTKNINDKHIVICQDGEINIIKKFYKISESNLEKTNIIDETVRYTKYVNYHFLSLILIDENKKKNEINLFFSSNWLIIEYDSKKNKKMSSVMKKFHSNIEKRIGEMLKNKNDNIVSKGLHIVMSSFIFENSVLLEKYENDIETLQNKVLVKIDETLLDEIIAYRNNLYNIRKHLRATKNIPLFSEDNNDIGMSSNIFLMFKNIRTRVHELFEQSNDMLLYSNRLISILDTKLNTKTNLVITRLTIITVLIGVATVVVSYFGMNFGGEGNYFSSPWGWLVIFIALVVFLLVSIFILKKRKSNTKLTS
ncbi:MAG: CorA family divalent cation transporter [Mycoplasmataceae bacterium]|nr:CorA family divalent cation transporter [Mycoplasmataceae bacterium]